MDYFRGYDRPSGGVGIRSHVIVMSSVVCANGVVDQIVREVPGAVPITHQEGCGRGPVDIEIAVRTLTNLGKNANVAAALIVGLGCEWIRAELLANGIAESRKPVEYLDIQKTGGTRRSVRAGVKIVNKFLTEARRQKRKKCGMESLVMGLQCGGSDAFSGITANPAVGFASDWLVKQGGTVILTENTEMIGTTHVLERRAASPQIAREVAELIAREKGLTEEHLGPLASLVISPGNMDGGMSSIEEKSLGCIIKGGTTTITQVVRYGEIPTEKGLVIMDAPGSDVYSITGEVAGGAQLVLFTTGRGTPVGFPIAPVVKIASNNDLYRSLSGDMDINAGAVLDEGMSLPEVGAELIAFIRRVLEGKKTRAELNRQGVLAIQTRGPVF
ncbi:MAG: UxaA family hydrolase [Deltaproteobacteria bacterium]|nr:MAG: UxaA family hydrolase [Deltaproteobacteria bacterium]